MDAVLVALITGGLSLIGVIYNSKKGHSAILQDVKTEMQLIQKDIQELDKSVKKHNGLVERMYSAEKEISVLHEQQKVANHRISDLEQKE